MNNQTSSVVLDSLEDVLEAERKALIAGDLEGVKRLLDRKEKLVEQFSGLDLDDHDQLEMVSAKLMRNQNLLTQAMSGLRSVADRLQALRRVRQSLETYSADGSKRTVDLSVSKKLEKRA